MIRVTDTIVLDDREINERFVRGGVLAARILALQDEGLAKRLVEYRAGMAKDVEKKAKTIEERHKSTRRSDSESSR